MRCERGRPRPGAGGDPRPPPPERGQHLRPAAWATALADSGRTVSVVEVAGRPALVGARPAGPLAAAWRGWRTARSSWSDGLLASGSPTWSCPPRRGSAWCSLMHLPVGAGRRAGGGPGRRRRSSTPSAWSPDRLLEATAPTRRGRRRARLARRTAARGRTGGRTRGRTVGGRLLCVGAVTPARGRTCCCAALAGVAGLPWCCACVGPLHLDPGFAARLRREAAGPGSTSGSCWSGPRVGGALDATYAGGGRARRWRAGRRPTGWWSPRPWRAGLPVDRHRRRRRARGAGRAAGRDRPGLLVRPGTRTRWPTRSGAGSRTRGCATASRAARGAASSTAVAGLGRHRGARSAAVLDEVAA